MSSLKCRCKCRCIKNCDRDRECDRDHECDCDRDRECDHEEEKEWIRQAIKEVYWRGFKDGCRKCSRRDRDREDFEECEE